MTSAIPEPTMGSYFKADVFADEITAEEQKIIDDRIGQIRKRMQEQERQQFKNQVKQVHHPYASS